MRERIFKPSSSQAFALAAAAAGILAMATVSAPASDQKSPAPPTPEQATFFETKIRPILATNCLPCHSAKSHMSGLALDSRTAFLKGGDSGPLTVAGDPDKSLLIQAVRQTGPVKMPQGGKLKSSEISDLESWVKMGAPWPDEGKAKTAQSEPLWSLQPVRNPPAPKVRLKGWVVNPIDSFVLSKLEERHLSPAPVAERRTLLRRVTYDLTGLPPTAEEVDAFLADKGPNAYEKVVDRLLASPRYGERWGRHWLDVARYADTKGYVFNEDRNYYNAYTYRDWVIDAMNRDLPYDQFITQQLAADLIPAVQQGDDKRPLAALGFLTVGRRFLNATEDIMDDRIDVTMRGFEGFTVACARCHDHKFDPIPTQDYYSLYSVFNSSEEKAIPISNKSIVEPWEKHNQEVTSTQGALHDLVAREVKVLRQEVATPNEAAQVPTDVKSTLQTVAVDQVPEGAALDVLAKGFDGAGREQFGQFQSHLATLTKDAPVSPEFAMGMEDRSNASDGVIFRRGNPGMPGGPAPRRFLLALSKPGEERAHWTKGSGRLELAKAIASKDNPLTARVFVNRMWLHDFGAGIVRTPSDFGHQGEKPTDPELLDYLATYFMKNDWSMKKLNRLMVTSATYRQSSDVTGTALNGDPDNRLWGRMNRKRLDMEEMRDSLAFGAGKLDLRGVGGKSVDLWSQPFTERRAVYGFIERQNLPGIFRAFDFATPDSTSPKRFQTTVPQQALFFMNSPFAVQQAESAVARPEIVASKDDAQRVRRLYRELFGRLPDQEETALGVRYLGTNPLAPVPSLEGCWKYGYGAYDEATARVRSFVPFTVLKNGGYQVGDKFPDPTLGYVTIRADGGHPGHDPEHAVIRRWEAPTEMTVSIQGLLAHGQAEGDGVRARIVSSRKGLLGEWRAHHSTAKTEVASVAVEKGDTLDFVVDPLTNDGFDSFSWAPQIKSLTGAMSWNASADFGPPPTTPLTRLALYAQALMMTNEFMFVD